MVTSKALCICAFFTFLDQLCITADQHDCRPVSSINEYTLRGHAYKSITGKQLTTCVITCDGDPNCYSLNYRFPTSICELNGGTRVSHPEHFVYTADSVYLEHLSRPAGSCSGGWPCSNKATCVNVPMMPGYKCYCQEGYTGELCQDCKSPPIGISDEKYIGNSRIAGSSTGQWVLDYFEPYKGRLHGPSSWVPGLLDSTPWLQVNLGPKTRLVTHIATQGSPVQSWWTKKYRVCYGIFNGSLKDYRESGVRREFNGNTDRNGVVKHALRDPFEAKIVRIYPTDSNTRSALRLELYGCIVY
ncbi:lactadherin [Nematostella vectensis]|uniref:lactadherin n=1 Tax=Nematostella vectensis TaxID=45351 RepID=UPI0020771E30|nr:lactadherin [Nematostella vectensis]